jgi:formylglycine-generating enzyme required for sulfatase activity
MRLERSSWSAFIARALVLGAVVFGAVRLAMARDGVAGGPSRSFLTVSGTLTGAGVPASPIATFRFSHTVDGGVGDGVLCAPSVPITDRDTATGAFSVEVPLDQAGRECPRSLFDGSDAFVEVSIGSTVVVPRRPINPVPYARFADQAGVNNDCPAGYARIIESDAGVSPGVLRCSRGVDEVVKVGVRGSAFWIDRYEASVWSNEAATDVQFGAGPAGADDYPSSFPDNGQWTTPLYALSYAAGGVESAVVFPSRSLTWFQAQAACRASGKRLPTGEEWLAAAQGTVDPGSNVGNPGPCRTGAGAPRQTGLARYPSVPQTCVSRWGAEDMIGNVWEWTAEWYGGLSGGLDGAWPFGGDIASNLTVGASPTTTGVRERLPAAAVRGGGWNSSEAAGVFALGLDNAASTSSPGIGFRCVIPR